MTAFNECKVRLWVSRSWRYRVTFYGTCLVYAPNGLTSKSFYMNQQTLGLENFLFEIKIFLFNFGV